MVKFQSNLILLALALISRASADEELLHTYEPGTSVTDHAAIDLDQQAIEQELAAGTLDGRNSAKRIYEEGAFSKSFAVLNLTTALTSDLEKGMDVLGTNSDGDEIRGYVLDGNAKSGTSIVRVQYASINIQDGYVTCLVGANPEPVTEGCFIASGEITVGEDTDPLSYTYTVEDGNQNARTIQGFSLQAKDKMYDCGDPCPYDTYKKFYDYYGAYDYANQWVSAGFNKAKADFDNGSADFSLYEEEGLTQVIQKGTAYMNIWMYVIRELEDAVDDCESDCTIENCNDDQVHAWDEAVAFYTGSIVKSKPKGGVLLYTLAQKRCVNFGTCGDDGIAGVNTQIFAKFGAGKTHIQAGKCGDATKLVAEITNLMTVPLVQGTIRYAHIIGEEDKTSEKNEAEGAAFAAAVLPVLHACNPGDATTVYESMKTGSREEAKDFAAVKKAFEDNYECMGITCADVGGLLQADGENYFDVAAPCGIDDSVGSTGTGVNSGNPSGALQVGFAVGAVATAVVALI